MDRTTIIDSLDMYTVLQDLGFERPIDKGNDWFVTCPYTEHHEDDTPSMAVQKETGVCYCHGCGETSSLFHFYAKVKGVAIGEAYRELTEVAVKNGAVVASPSSPTGPTSATKRSATGSTATPPAARPPIDMDLVKRWHTDLMNRMPMKKLFLIDKWGIEEATIKKFMIGHDGDRYTLPVFDAAGTVVNVRRYMPNAKADKMKNYASGGHSYGSPAQLYPVSALSHPIIIITEGEKDCIVASHHGFNAITTTSGANYWNSEWTKLFKEKIVYICYDADAAGRKGAQKLAEQLNDVCEVLIVELPDDKAHEGFDITNFFVDHGASALDFQELVNDAKTFSKPMELKPDEPEPVEVPLALASMAEFNGKPILTNVIVSGKDMAPYLVPQKIKVRCGCGDGESACPTCPRWKNPANKNPSIEYEATFTVEANNAQLLKLINCSDTQQKGYLKELGGVAKRCGFGLIDVIEFGNVQQIICIPELDQQQTASFANEEYEYVSRTAYYLGHNIIANRSYKMKGYTHPEPKTQHATHVFDHKDDMQDSVRSFVLTEEIHKQLRETFSLKPGQSIEDKLNDIYNYCSRNVHYIRGRQEIQLAFDLVWHSVLHFNFLGQPVRKGWLETLIIGDTAQGKTELTSRMRDYYNLGARITGEKTSTSGLVGGLQKMGDRWILQWGAYPQNDRRAILIDEYSSLSEDDIANMTDLRSTGIAEIVKIRTERTNARVRAVLCSNARSGNMLKTYTQAITAIQQLMGKSEDIRRLDFAIIAATGEVDLAEINKPISMLPMPKQEYPQDACRNLVLWAWSRNVPPNVNQVRFSKAAEEAILAASVKLGKKYHPKIPLVEPSDQRLKIARMATALSVRLFSSDETGQLVLVEKEHVEYIVDWLEKQYDKPSMAYNTWSESEWRADRFKDGVEETLAKHLIGLPNGEDIVNFLFAQTTPFRAADMENACGLDRETQKDLIRELTKNYALVNTPNGFKSQPNLNELLRKLKSGVPIGKSGVVLPV